MGHGSHNWLVKEGSTNVDMDSIYIYNYRLHVDICFTLHEHIYTFMDTSFTGFGFHK